MSSRSNAIVKKKLLKTMRRKKKKHDIIFLARSNSNSIENIISKALPDTEITHEEFATTVNK